MARDDFLEAVMRYAMPSRQDTGCETSTMPEQAVILPARPKRWVGACAGPLGRLGICNVGTDG